jgi:hypothetical protein
MVMNIQPWQLDILDKMTKYKGKGLLQVTGHGRNVGKSVFSQQAIERLMRDLNSNPISNIILSEGTVYGSRYYTVEPVGGNWPEMEAWCYQAFGDDSYPIWGESKAQEPAQRLYKNNRKFWFRNEADRTMFVLKWR